MNGWTSGGGGQWGTVQAGRVKKIPLLSTPQSVHSWYSLPQCVSHCVGVLVELCFRSGCRTSWGCEAQISGIFSQCVWLSCCRPLCELASYLAGWLVRVGGGGGGGGGGAVCTATPDLLGHLFLSGSSGGGCGMRLVGSVLQWLAQSVNGCQHRSCIINLSRS